MEKNSRNAVTINDVARISGVSITTVSRVLNNNYPVKKETRERVERAVKELKYIPNVIARGLIMKRTLVIGVIVPGLTNLFFPTIVEAIDSITREKKYTISLNNTAGDSRLERELINKVLAMQVDGIIVIDPAEENLDNGFYDGISMQVPLIVVNASSKRDNLHYISYNEEIGTLKALDYFYELGHRKIAFLRGGQSFSYDIKEKLYSNFLSSHGLEYKKIIKIEHGNSIETPEEAKCRVKEVLQASNMPTAILACNDLMAVGVIAACNDMGIEVPTKISIIGSDNTLIASITYPKLTTIDLKMGEVGRLAAERILEFIDNKDIYKIKDTIDTGLVVRDSCSKINIE